VLGLSNSDFNGQAVFRIICADTCPYSLIENGNGLCMDWVYLFNGAYFPSQPLLLYGEYASLSKSFLLVYGFQG
jgi:hypothetical protein